MVIAKWKKRKEKINGMKRKMKIYWKKINFGLIFHLLKIFIISQFYQYTFIKIHFNGTLMSNVKLKIIWLLEKWHLTYFNKNFWIILIQHSDISRKSLLNFEKISFFPKNINIKKIFRNHYCCVLKKKKFNKSSKFVELFSLRKYSLMIFW